jgi:hypothetical protein
MWLYLQLQFLKATLNNGFMGFWDTSKWSTIESTVAITLDGVTVASTGKVVHVATVAITLDDVAIASSGVITRHATIDLPLDDIINASNGNITRHATLALTLDDVDIVIAGQDVHAGPLNLQLDDVDFASSGNVIKHGDLSLQLDDITFEATGQDGHTGTLAVALDDLIIYFQGADDNQQQHRGGFDTKKRKPTVYKDERQELESQIAKAIAKVTGEDQETATSEVEVKVVELVETPNYQLQEMVMKAQAMALQAEIDLLIQAELDDEESLMLLL